MSSTEQALREQGLDAGAFPLTAVVAALDHEVRLLPVAAAAFTAMLAAAARDGVEIVAVSGYRSVPRQEAIWNAKFEAGLASGCGPEEALRRNLVFSAPPGWSRHHWGSDVDVVAAALRGAARLEPEDWIEGGVCHALTLWLDRRAAEFGFVAPYDIYRGGFAAEPWHLSFAPPAQAFLPRMRRIDWFAILREKPWSGADLIARNLAQDFPRFVYGVQPRLRAALSR